MGFVMNRKSKGQRVTRAVETLERRVAFLESRITRWVEREGQKVTPDRDKAELSALRTLIGLVSGRQVWVLTEERNVDDRPMEGPDAWVLSVYATEELANQAKKRAQLEAIAAGKTVFDAERGEDWDVDFEVRSFPVLSAVPDTVSET